MALWHSADKNWHDTNWVKCYILIIRFPLPIFFLIFVILLFLSLFFFLFFVFLVQIHWRLLPVRNKMAEVWKVEWGSAFLLPCYGDWGPQTWGIQIDLASPRSICIIPRQLDPYQAITASCICIWSVYMCILSGYMFVYYMYIEDIYIYIYVYT